MKLFREKKRRQCLHKISIQFRGEHHTQQDKRDADIQNTNNNTNKNNDEINVVNVETIVAAMYIHRSSVEWQQDKYN